MKILLAGATGLIGQALTKRLLEEGHKLVMLSRTAKTNTPDITYFKWGPSKNELDDKALEGVEAIVNLAGAGVADKRWNKTYKKEILDSRVRSTRILVDKMFLLHHQVKVFVNASASGYYGYNTGDTVVDENSPLGTDFLADVVKQWEDEAYRATRIGVRTVTIRTGIVLSANGGALPKLAKPIKLNLGANLGSGKQYVSWIDIDDLVSMFVFCMNDAKAEGPYNAVASHPIRQEAFNQAIAQVLEKKILLPAIPKIVLRGLLGEFANALVGGNNISNAKIKAIGFQFSYEYVGDSLKHHLATSKDAPTKLLKEAKPENA
jgi:uncharacterized protein (TIGR01777 family)